MSEQDRRKPARLMYLSREAGHHSHELQDALRQAAEDREAIEAIAASRSSGSDPFAMAVQDGILVWFGNDALSHSQVPAAQGGRRPVSGRLIHAPAVCFQPPPRCMACPDLDFRWDLNKYLCKRTSQALPLDQFNAGNPTPPECDSAWEEQGEEGDGQ